MTELERLKAENAELRAHLVEAAQSVAAFVNLAAEIRDVLDKAAEAVRPNDPSLADSVSALSGRWDEFAAPYRRAIEIATMMSAQSSLARN